MAEGGRSYSEKASVAAVLGDDMTQKIWTVNYERALPFTLQDFSVGALLPAMLYMARWGHRRGKGEFQDAFRREKGRKVTIEDVAVALADDAEATSGFEGEAGRAILGDMLLNYCLENAGHKLGRREQVQRAFPTHYFASWVDLPGDVGHLRLVPEMLVALLRDQPSGRVVESGADGQTRFPVGVRPGENLLLDLFATGVKAAERLGDMGGDRFDESAKLGLDQLLTVRIAQHCASAPQKARAHGVKSEVISNQHPLARAPAARFRADLRVLLAAYGRTTPRQSLLPMLESCIGLGLTNLLLTTAGMLFDWGKTGVLPPPVGQKPWPLFVDCSGSADPALRDLAEESMSECQRRLARLPVVLMCLRVLEYEARRDPDLRKLPLPDAEPDGTGWINFLGGLLQGAHPQSGDVRRMLDRSCNGLADRLEADDHSRTAVEMLRGGNADTHPAWRLAEAVTLLMGDNLQRQQVMTCLDSCLMLDQSHGLARTRKAKLRLPGPAGRKTAELRSVVLSNTTLDYLVHRHQRSSRDDGKGWRPLSLAAFIGRLREFYGLHVDAAPPELSVPKELLRRNRDVLERRLRDLGLLTGVNDAESMKRLRQRFTAAGDDYATT